MQQVLTDQTYGEIPIYQFLLNYDSNNLCVDGD